MKPIKKIFLDFIQAMEHGDGGNIWEDGDHFVFTLKNNIGAKPKRCKRRVNGMHPIVTVWDDKNEDNVVAIPLVLLVY
ncbi:hypothetical protein QTN25_003262 [Entamoeba marina]